MSTGGVANGGENLSSTRRSWFPGVVRPVRPVRVQTVATVRRVTAAPGERSLRSLTLPQGRRLRASGAQDDTRGGALRMNARRKDASAKRASGTRPATVDTRLDVPCVNGEV